MTRRDALDIETRCSKACTRSGLIALLVAVFAISLTGPLTQQKASKAMIQYFSQRMLLKTAIDILDQDACWEQLREREKDLESSPKWTVKMLLEYRCEEQRVRVPVGPVDEKNVVVPKPPVTDKSIAKGDSTASPSAPGELGFTATVPAAPSQMQLEAQFFSQLTGIALIGDSLTKLDDQDMLRKARAASWMIDHSVYKWTLLQSRLMRGQRGKEAVLNNFTMENVRRLAKYEFPDFGTKIQESASEVTLYPATAKLELFPAINCRG